MPKNSEVAEIYSIFGQIETVVAEGMIDEGTAKRLPWSPAIPEHLLVNERGEKASMIVTIKNKDIATFERRVAELLA